jgi:hypothetical protein
VWQRPGRPRRPGPFFDRGGCYGRAVPRRLLLVLVLTLAVIGAACGSTTDTYRSQIDKVQKRFQPKLAPLESQLATAIRDRRTDDAADLARQVATLLERCADDVAAVDPPDRLEPRAATLVRAYRKLVGSLRTLETALRARKAAPINAAISSYNDARLDETSAVAALNSN